MIHAVALRRKVERILGRSIPEGYWWLAEKQGYLADYELTGEIEVLVDFFRDQMEAEERNRAEPRQKAEQSRTVPPDERLRYLAKILGIEAARLPEVIRFRKTYLGGRLLAFDEVEEWIKRTAAADGPGSIWFTIPVRVDCLVKRDGPFPRVRDLLETLAQLPRQRTEQVRVGHERKPSIRCSHRRTHQAYSNPTRGGAESPQTVG